MDENELENGTDSVTADAQPIRPEGDDVVADDHATDGQTGGNHDDTDTEDGEEGEEWDNPSDTEDPEDEDDFDNDDDTDL